MTQDLKKHKTSLLRNIRQGKGLSVRAVARELGVDHSHISRVESGDRDITVSIALRLAQLYEEPVETLFGDTLPARLELKCAGCPRRHTLTASGRGHLTTLLWTSGWLPGVIPPEAVESDPHVTVIRILHRGHLPPPRPPWADICPDCLGHGKLDPEWARFALCVAAARLGKWIAPEEVEAPSRQDLASPLERYRDDRSSEKSE